MGPIKKYQVSLFVVFLHYAGQIAIWSVESNRSYYYWDRRVAAAIILGIILVSLFAWGLSLAVCKLRSAIIRRLFDQLFLLVLASGLLASCGGSFVDPIVPTACWLAVLAVIGYSFARPPSELAKFVHYGALLCLIFSPVVPICFVQMLSWSDWGRSAEQWPMVQKAGNPGIPVFVFVFDEWSYRRSTHDGEFHPWFENLRGLCQQSVVFRRAYSPGSSTDISIPRIMFQTDKRLLVHNGNSYLVDGSTRVIASDVPSLFQLSGEHGYTSVLIGFYLPYQAILKHQVDYCFAYPYDPIGQTVLQEMVLSAHRNIEYWTDPFSKRVWLKTYPHVLSRYWFALSLQVGQHVSEMIEKCPSSTFAFVHWPIPHAPFVFNPDGSYYGPFEDDRLAGTPEDYQRQLLFLDRLIGQLAAELKASGKFDRSMIILTSDHSWRRETDPSFCVEMDWERRVPLIIKLPGQRSGHVIKRVFCTNQLKPLFQAVFAGECDTQKLVRLLQETAASKE